jgi:hypothetical protein
MYEHRRVAPLPRARFLRRLGAHFLLSGGLVALSLAGGMAGYRHFEGLGWRDAFVESAMLLGGMGAIHAPQTDGGKLFAGCYALYAGLVFVVTAGIMLAPVVHRIMHVLHWEEESRAG